MYMKKASYRPRDLKSEVMVNCSYIYTLFRLKILSPHSVKDNKPVICPYCYDRCKKRIET